MQPPVNSLMRRRPGAAVAAALTSLLISADPLSADEADQAGSADEGATYIQEDERGAPGYYEEQARKAKKRAEEREGGAADYYEEQARGAKKRAEEREGEAAEYYEEQARGAKKRAEEREGAPPTYYREGK